MTDGGNIDCSKNNRGSSADYAGSALDAEKPWANWSEKLKEARARREQVLAAADRKQIPPKVRLAAPVLRSFVTGRGRIDTPLFAKGFMVFAAALGLGLGVTLGLGALHRTSDISTAVPVEATVMQEKREASPHLSAAKASYVVSSPERAGSVSPWPTPLINARLEVDDPVGVSISAVLPRIKPVALMRGDQTGGRLSPLPKPLPPYAQFAFETSEKKLVPVYLHVPSGVSQLRISTIGADVASAGGDIARVGRESVRVSATHLRYYSAASAEAAMALGADLEFPVRDFSDTGSGLDRIELWVAGKPEGAQSSQVDPDTFVSRLRERRALR